MRVLSYYFKDQFLLVVVMQYNFQFILEYLNILVEFRELRVNIGSNDVSFFNLNSVNIILDLFFIGGIVF